MRHLATHLTRAAAAATAATAATLLLQMPASAIVDPGNGRVDARSIASCSPLTQCHLVRYGGLYFRGDLPTGNGAVARHVPLAR